MKECVFVVKECGKEPRIETFSNEGQELTNDMIFDHFYSLTNVTKANDEQLALIIKAESPEKLFNSDKLFTVACKAFSDGEIDEEPNFIYEEAPVFGTAILFNVKTAGKENLPTVISLELTEAQEMVDSFQVVDSMNFIDGLMHSVLRELVDRIAEELVEDDELKRKRAQMQFDTMIDTLVASGQDEKFIEGLMATINKAKARQQEATQAKN